MTELGSIHNNWLYVLSVIYVRYDYGIDTLINVNCKSTLKQPNEGDDIMSRDYA